MYKIGLILILISLLILSFGTKPTKASSTQAYQDYLYQWDVYRKNLIDFQSTRNEFLKYNSLASRSDTLVKAKTYQMQRLNLLQTYFTFLKEKLNEDQGLTLPVKQKIFAQIQEEVLFLLRQRTNMPNLASPEEAQGISEIFEKQYPLMTGTIQIAAVNLQMGQLNSLAMQIDEALLAYQNLLGEHRADFSSAKLETIDHWLLSLRDQLKIYKTTLSQLQSTIDLIKPEKRHELSDQLRIFSKTLNQARNELNVTANYLRELLNASRTID